MIEPALHSVDRLRSKNFDGYIAGQLDSQPVIFLHGWAGSKDIWLGFLKRCPEDFVYVSLDLPSTGGTPDLSSFEPEPLAEWLSAVADELGFVKFHLVGHSMGGNISAWTASKLQHRVKSLLLISPALAGHEIAAAGPYLSPCGRTALRATCYGAAAMSLIDVIHPHRHDGGHWRSWWRRYRYVIRDNSADGLLAQLRYLTQFPFDLAELDPFIPVKIIHGLKDLTIPVSRSREATMRRARNTDLSIYRSSVHCAMDDEFESTLADLEAFIRRVSFGGADII